MSDSDLPRITPDDIAGLRAAREAGQQVLIVDAQSRVRACVGTSSVRHLPEEPDLPELLEFGYKIGTMNEILGRPGNGSV